MKKLFLSVLAVGILLSACNQAAKQDKAADSTAVQSAATDGPLIKFEYAMHDFGKVQQGDKVTYKFNFVNTGKTPLIIENAQASCGCTTPTWPKGPVKPGGSGQVVVTFNSAGRIGLQDKMITITANTNPRQSVVHLVGEVLPKK